MLQLLCIPYFSSLGRGHAEERDAIVDCALPPTQRHHHWIRHHVFDGRLWGRNRLHSVCRRVLVIFRRSVFASVPSPRLALASAVLVHSMIQRTPRRFNEFMKESHIERSRRNKNVFRDSAQFDEQDPYLLGWQRKSPCITRCWFGAIKDQRISTMGC